jgi:hypothetical protein
LPAFAGPWVRTDGTPFAAGVADLLCTGGAVYTPALCDELGNRQSSRYYWTGTLLSGELDPSGTSTCNNWTSGLSADEALSGNESTTSRYWTQAAGTYCHYNEALLCLEGGGGGAPLADFITDERVAFLTSSSGSGDLSTWPDAAGKTGLAAADAVCQAHATLGAFPDPGSFRAWLSDGATHARDRFANDGRWVRPDGIRIADSIADLTDGNLFTSINVTESGEYYDSWSGVWTGTDDDGSATGSHCDSWTKATENFSGTTGGPLQTIRFWTSEFTRDCDSEYRLYCFSDQPSTWVFGDAFEHGLPGGWSAVVN